MKVKVIGAGLSGVEAAYYLANRGVKVVLYDIKPKAFTPAHKSENFAELVCSNSLKSADVFGNAAGLLKEEMRLLGSLTMEAAEVSKVPAGGALAVNREEFSRYITDKIKSHKNIECIAEEITKIPDGGYTLIATGPLTTAPLAEDIKSLAGALSFYDASAPIISADSIDMNSAFKGDRYGRGGGDHINCPMNKEEYPPFVISASTIAMSGGSTAQPVAYRAGFSASFSAASTSMGIAITMNALKAPSSGNFFLMLNPPIFALIISYYCALRFRWVSG